MNNDRRMVMTEIVLFCNLSRDETRIRHRFSLNTVQTEAYLVILKRQKLLTYNNGRYQTTEQGKIFLASCDRTN
jgi:predicted transcriptional regulator